jgi:hypothetical protein
MPNWCNNVLTVSGPESDVAAFMKAARGRGHSYNEYPYGNDWGAFDDIRLKVLTQTLPPSPEGPEEDLCFHSLYPVPDYIRCYPYDSGVAARVAKITGETRPVGGYEWENKNWGVKWGASDPRIQSSEPGLVEYVFDTAWGPALDWHKKVSENWPTLHFSLHYEEPGMCFAGDATWEAGVTLDHDEYEYNYEDELNEDEEVCNVP